MMKKQLKWIRNWCPMAPMHTGSKIAALAYSRLAVPSARQPFLLLVTLFGVQLILFGTLGAVGWWQYRAGEWTVGYDSSKFFWSCATAFAAVMLLAMFGLKSKRLALLSASSALIMVAFQHLSDGLLLKLSKSNVLNEAWSISSVLAAVPLLMLGIFLIRDRTFGRKIYYPVIAYGLIQAPINVAISLYIASLFAPIDSARFVLETTTFLLNASACLFMALAATRAAKHQSELNLERNILRPIGAAFLSYGGAQLTSFIYLLMASTGFTNQPNYLFITSYQAILTAVSLLLIGLAIYFIRAKTLRLNQIIGG